MLSTATTVAIYLPTRNCEKSTFKIVDFDRQIFETIFEKIQKL